MPGFILHLGAQVNCSHMGKADPTSPNPRVTVSAQPVTTLATPYVVAGCPNTVPGPSPFPCLTAQFMTSATRVLAGGVPVLLFDSQATCAPTGVPLQVLTTQMRVSAT